MSADDYGTKLLAEVQEQSLASFLSDIRAFVIPQPKVITGLPELDNIISLYRYAEPRAAQGQTAISSEPNLASEADWERLDSDSDGHPMRVIHPRPVTINVSLAAPGSSAAATNLLYSLLAMSTLPKALGGRGSFAVYVDCNHSFSATQLLRTTSCHVLRVGKLSDEAEAASLSTSAMLHSHVIRCTSSRSLLQSLQDLSAYLFDPTAHNSFQRPLGLLVVSGINAFHWQDRFDAEITRLENINGAGAPAASNASDSIASRILNELTSIQSTFSCPIVYTSTPKNSIPTEVAHVSGVRHPEYSETDSFDINSQHALLNLNPTRATPPKFAAGMTLEECLRDRDKRGEAVEKANERYWFAASAGGQSGRDRDTRVAGGDGLGFLMRVESSGDIVYE